MRSPTRNAKEHHPPAHLPVGIGMRAAHYDDIINAETSNLFGWIEVHPENYFGGGLHKDALKRACEKYPLSLHATGLSLGSDQPVSHDHLDQIKALIDAFNPFHISDHVSWSASGNAHLNDLLPLPYTYETLDRLCRNIDQTQNAFQRPILVENPSSYLSFKDNDMSEPEFLNALAAKTGCGLLLDINNIYVQANNHNFDAQQYLDTITAHHVKEMHLAGHIERKTQSRPLLIDTHSRPVCDPVWELYRAAIKRFGVTPTLIEWDQDLPPFTTLLNEVARANAIIQDIEAQNVPA